MDNLAPIGAAPASNPNPPGSADYTAWENSRIANLTGGGAGGAAPAGDTKAYDTLAANTPSTLDFINNAEQPANAVLDKYIKAMQQRANPLDVYTGLENAMGLPAQRKTAATIRDQIGNLEDAIRNVEPTVAATTGNSLVTQGQRDMMIAAGKEPLTEKMARFTTDLGRVTEGITAMEKALGTKTDLYLKGQEQQLEPFKVQLQAYQDRAARLVTGFTADKAANLDIALAKIKRGEQLTDTERANAFQLLTLEKSYQNELDKMNKQSTINIAEAKVQSGIGLSDYERKLQLDLAYKPSDSGGGSGNSEDYYGATASSSINTGDSFVPD